MQSGQPVDMGNFSTGTQAWVEYICTSVNTHMVADAPKKRTREGSLPVQAWLWPRAPDAVLQGDRFFSDSLFSRDKNLAVSLACSLLFFRCTTFGRVVGFGVWLSLHLRTTDTRPLRGCLITATLFCACSFSNKVFHKSQPSSAAPPRLRCLQLAETPRHVAVRFRY